MPSFASCCVRGCGHFVISYLQCYVDAWSGDFCPKFCCQSVLKPPEAKAVTLALFCPVAERPLLWSSHRLPLREAGAAGTEEWLLFLLTGACTSQDALRPHSILKMAPSPCGSHFSSVVKGTSESHSQQLHRIVIPNMTGIRYFLSK